MLHTKADSRSEVAPRLWSADPSDSSLAGEFPKWERWSWAMSSMGLAESELSKCRAGEYVSGQFIESNQVENWVFCSVNKNLDWVKQAGSRNIKSVQGGKFFFFFISRDAEVAPLKGSGSVWLKSSDHCQAAKG